MTQMEVLLEKVLELTKNDKITWHTTVNTDAFLTVRGNQSVVIVRRSGGLPDPEYKLEVRNSGGSPVASLRSDEYSPSQQTPLLSERRQQMEQLFKLARKSAVDSGLREVIERLDELIEDLEKV